MALQGGNYRTHLNASRSTSCGSNPVVEKNHPESPVPTARLGGCAAHPRACETALDAADICATFWLTEWIPNYTLE